MHENIVSAVLLDEPVSFAVVKPLHRTVSHPFHPFPSEMRRAAFLRTRKKGKDRISDLCLILL
jgi:hypothetical protein